MNNKLMDFLRNLVAKYDCKNDLSNNSPVYICTRPETRNRYKNDNYKIPEDQPQCPIYKDNRCCGGCEKASVCDHCVDCGCFGYTYARRGATDELTYMRKASQYYESGRIGKDGKFDWEYYNFNELKKRIYKEPYVLFKVKDELYVGRVNGRIKHNKKFKVYIPSLDYYKIISISDLYSKATYGDYEKAKLWHSAK